MIFFFLMYKIISESLWDFLTNLDISCLDNHCHPYFGNVKYLINEVKN